MTAEPGLRERKKQETRRHLASTALAMFLERGFDEVSVAEVAEAAGVSKMTVFNHFPAKEDLVFALAGDGLPDLAAAVRERAPGESAIGAVHALVRADFIARGADEDRHGHVVAFLRMAFGSPTLLERFGRQWNAVQSELAAALAEAIGDPPPPADIEQNFLRAVRGDSGSVEMQAWLRNMNRRSMMPFFVAGQIVSMLQEVTMTNLVRMGAGVSLKESTKAALRDVEAGFGLLEKGLADFAVREP